MDANSPSLIDSLWDYSKPADSEARFRAALDNAEGDLRLELMSQVARTYSLRRMMEQAHAALDQIEPKLSGAGPAPRVRYLLERGRTFNSAGEPERARGLFLEAWAAAREAGLEGLAVDAAHMVAITYRGSAESIDWNRKGLELARSSADYKARALIPAMLNNAAWDLHELGRLEEALALFEEALAEWTERQKPEQIRIAKWSVARCLRSMHRLEAALEIQRALEHELDAAGAVDGFVFEEIGELLDVLGRTTEARPYFARAFEELRKDDWIAANETQRLASLKLRGES